MKIRSGFVSNSSSSSFLIYGMETDSEQIVKALGKAEYDDLDNWDLYEKLREAAPELVVETPFDQVYIGLSWDSVRDSETGRDFKDRVLKILQRAGFDVTAKDLDTYAEAWSDG